MLFFSTFLYAFARKHGKRWHDEVRRELTLGVDSSVEALRTLTSLTVLREEIATNISAPMRLAAGRSDMAGRFLATGADVWVSCDDDAQADSTALVPLVRAARETRGIVSAPCLQRGDPDAPLTIDKPGLLNVRPWPGDPVIEAHEGFTLARIHSTGFGLVAVHRETIETMCQRFPELETHDEETGRRIPALFFERITEVYGVSPVLRRWQGEDMAFCARARESELSLHALLGVDVIHAGRRVRMEQDGGALALRVFDLAELPQCSCTDSFNRFCPVHAGP